MKRSDGCTAWLIPPLPKKAKLSGASEADKSKNRAAAPVATHIIDYVDIEFEIAGAC